MTEAEQQQIIANTNKLIAEQQKLLAEAGKLRIDRWVTPIIIIFGGIGSVIGAASAVYRLIHG